LDYRKGDIGQADGALARFAIKMRVKIRMFFCMLRMAQFVFQGARTILYYMNYMMVGK
jgi:hypothetical protein